MNGSRRPRAAAPIASRPRPLLNLVPNTRLGHRVLACPCRPLQASLRPQTSIYQGHCVQAPSDTDRTHASGCLLTAQRRAQPRHTRGPGGSRQENPTPTRDSVAGYGMRWVLGATVHTDRLSYYTRHRIPIRVVHPYPNVVIVRISCEARRVPYITSDSTCAFAASHPLRQRTTSRINSYGITYVRSE